MDFGYGTYDNLSEKYFHLPYTDQPSLSGKKYTAPKIYIGLPKWGRKEWVGKLYPKGTRESQFLENYVHHFNAIELNATHYKIYGSDDISKWAAKANGRDFKFCPKFTNLISHFSGFSNVDILTDSFLKAVIEFGDNLGPIFLQVSEKYSPNQRDKLFKYLRSLPNDLQFFLEVRQADWFSDPEIKKELFNTLESSKIGAVITDTINRRDVLHMQLTVPVTFIRFVCYGDHPLDYYRIQQWKKTLSAWYQAGLQQAYFFIHAHNEESLINFSKHVQKELSSFV